MAHFMWNLLIINFIAVFHKTENLVVATFYLRNNLFTNSEFLGVVHHKMGPQILAFWLVVMATAKMLFSLIPWQLPPRVENPYSSTQNQNIKLIISLSFKSNWLLFLKIKCHKGPFLQLLLRSLSTVIGVKILKVLDFHFSRLYYIKIWSMLLLIAEFW